MDSALPTSYAQALEDVLLFRAFRNIGSGFYIDVGANDPVTDSVTKMFYESGWTGINIEASPFWYDRLVADRPRDTNLNVAASDSNSRVVFHEIVGTGLSTTIDEFAANHAAAGHERRSYEVECRTLESICSEYAADEIHFLKIDVEGAECSVIKGADFTRFRPWVVLVEATQPLSDIPSHQDWTGFLENSGYKFVLFDGLNRFYVADEKAELRRFFSFPADDYERAASIWTRGHWQLEAQRLETMLAGYTRQD